MPHERRRREADLPAARLQPPAHVHIVAGAQVDRIEAADGEQRLAAKRHVAAGHVLGDAIVEQHVGRTARRPGDALRHRRIVGRDDVRSAGRHDIRVQERLDEERQPVGVDPGVGVGIGDNLAGGVRQPDIACGAEAAVRHFDQVRRRMLPRDVSRPIAGAVVDDDDLEIGIVQPLERRETVFERVRRVVGADHDRDARPRLPGVLRKRRVGVDRLDGGRRRLQPAVAIDQAKRPVVDVMSASPPLVGPGKGDGAAGALFERRAQVHRGQPRLALFAFADAVDARFRQQQRLLSGNVLQPRQIGAQVLLAVQVDVERADVEERQVEEFGRREVHVGEQAIGRGLFRLGVEPAQKALDAKPAVPPHDPRRDLVAERKHQQGGVIGQLPDLVDGLALNRLRQRAVVEKCHVLRPRQADHHPQIVQSGLIEQLAATAGCRRAPC